VKDNENLTGTSTTTVNVTMTTDDFRAPVAEAAGPYTSLTYQSIHFDGSNSYGINASITYYLWAFGDGTYGYNVTSTHAYETAGAYTVVLTVTDSNNLIAIDTTTATIELDANRNNISDVMDQAIGANITQTDLHSLTIGGSLYYLVDTNHDGSYDTFYNPTTNTKNILGQQQGKQLIDVNGDGIWDFVYDPIYGTTSPYKKESPSGGIPWMNVGIIVFIVAIIVMIVLFYLRRNCYF
jgi:PKD repeat protein